MTIEESLATGYRKRLDMTHLEAAVTSNEDLGNQVAEQQVLFASGSPRQQVQQKSLYKQRERSLKNLVGIYQSKLKEEPYPVAQSDRASPTSMQNNQ